MNAGIALGAVRSPKLAKMRKGRSQALSTLRDKISPDDRPLWIHAASLGEFEQGRPLIERIKRELPGVKIVLSFFSPSGYEVRCNYPHADAVVYMPGDTPRQVRRFIDAVNPRAAIFVKYEFWGNFMQELARRNVPSYLISGIFRPSQSFFKPWGRMMRSILKCFTHMWVQDEESKTLLAGIGIDDVTVAGDTRFDRVTDIMKTAVEMPQIEAFTHGVALTLIVGSSWEADEAIYMPWVNSHPEVKVIIAPHEFDDKRVNKLRASIQGGAAPLSTYNPATDNVRALVVDSFGKLASIYRYCDVAYVGGGFGTGIHNINEAAVYDIPVVFGPKYSKFREAVDLIAIEGAFTIADRQQLETVMGNMLDRRARETAGRAAGEYVRSKLGATDKIYSKLCEVLV